MTPLSVRVNGTTYEDDVEPRLLFVHYLRDRLGLTGTNIGCDTSSCGACTVLVDGLPMRSCLLLAVQVDGRQVTTVEGLAREDRQGGQVLHPVQEAFRECHALQCGFCTPGMLMVLKDFLEENPAPDRDEVRRAISGNLCRCTGYQHIVDAAMDAAEQMRDGAREHEATPSDA